MAYIEDVIEYIEVNSDGVCDAFYRGAGPGEKLNQGVARAVKWAAKQIDDEKARERELEELALEMFNVGSHFPCDRWPCTSIRDLWLERAKMAYARLKGEG